MPSSKSEAVTPKAFAKVPESLVEEPTPAELNIDDDVSGHARLERKLFLGQPAFDTQFHYASAHSSPPSLPNLDTLGVILTEAGRHFLKLSGMTAG